MKEGDDGDRDPMKDEEIDEISYRIQVTLARRGSNAR